MNNSTVNRRSVLQGLSMLGGGLLGVAHAQPAKSTWPNKAIRVIVPFNAGGATDIVARTIGEALSHRIGQPVVIDNRGGAGGVLGTDVVAKAPADGYTLLFSTSTPMLVNQFLYTKLPYNLQKDIELISQIAGTPLALVTHPSVPVKNMKELLAYVKANKGKLSYGSWGVGSYAHLGGSHMSMAMDADMVHSAYKGEAPMIQDLIGGQVQICFSTVLNTKNFIESGRINAIGVTGKQRIPALPNVPSIYEQGVQDKAYALYGWLGMGAPAGLPKQVSEALGFHLSEIAKDPKVQERIKNAGLLPMINSAQEFEKNYRDELPIWKSLVETAGAKLD